MTTKGLREEAELMRMTVWVDDWQQQCCGAPFSIGSVVTWTLRDGDQDHLHRLLAGQSVTVNRSEEHHGGLPDDAPTTTGKVMGIRAVHVIGSLKPDGDGRTWETVPGSARLTKLQGSNGPEFSETGFAGYLVEIEV
jgi:hypothetical protein